MGILKSFKKISDLKIVDTKKAMVLEDPEQIKKVLEIQEVFSSGRPDQNIDQFTNEGVLSQNYFPYSEHQLYELYLYSAELRLSIGKVNSEVFRAGYDILPIVENPSVDQKELAEGFIHRANGNNQSLSEVFMQFGKDVDIFDDGFGVLAKNYFLDSKGKIIGGEVQEFFRVSPLFVDFLFSKDNKLGHDINNKQIYFDIEDRSIMTYDKWNANTNQQNMEAHFRIRSGTTWKYYNSSEIIHQSLHEPSLTRGHSPIRPLYNKVMSMIGMDYTIEKYYDKSERQPRSLLFVNTTNYDTILKWWKVLRQKVSRNPTAIHPIPVNNADGKKLIEFVDMMKPLNEMQYTQVRDEIRRTIAAFYGVSNVFNNDTTGGGGLNNEGLQIKVTNRAVEVRQTMYNEKVLPWIFQQMGITDYEIKLKSSKEEDQTYEIDLMAKKIANAEKLVSLGVNVRYEEGEFIINDGDLEKPDLNAVPPLPVFQGKVKKSNISLVKKVDQPKEAKDQVPKSLQEQFENNLMKELKVLTGGLLGKKLTKLAMNKFTKAAEEKLNKNLKKKAANQMKAIYSKAAEKESKLIGEKFSMSDADKAVVENIKQDPTWNKAFSNLSEETSNNLRSKIQEHFDAGEIDPDKLSKELGESVDASENQLNTIVRTETTKVSEAARLTQYEKKGLDNFLFEHVGPSDKRTTKMSKGAKSQTKGGVSWGEYVNAIEANKVSSDWTVNPQSPITHPNTRHIFTARPKED